MKEEYHAKFATILQTIYQRQRLAYFSNRIAKTFNLANQGKKINWCSIMLTQMSIEFDLVDGAPKTNCKRVSSTMPKHVFHDLDIYN
jgi:hypothetical protein